MTLVSQPPRRSEQCRRNARYCELLARDAATESDRWTLLTMQRSWLALAENEEWLDGIRAAREASPEASIHAPASQIAPSPERSAMGTGTPILVSR